MLQSPRIIKQQVSVTEKVISGIKQRDEACMTELFDTYSKPVFSFILKILPNQQLAEETLQAVFMKACTQIECFDEKKASIITWLLNSARNEAIDRLIEIQSKKLLINKAISQLVSPYCTPVHNFITGLNPFEKTIAALMFYRGLNADEISNITKIPASLIVSKIQIAQEKIKTLYPNPSS